MVISKIFERNWRGNNKADLLLCYPFFAFMEVIFLTISGKKMKKAESWKFLYNFL